MAQVTNTEEMTELNKAIQEARQEAATDGKPPKQLNLSDKQKGAIALGTVMLGGAAFVAMGQNSDGSVATPVTASPTTPADSTAVAPKPELAHGTTQPVAGGTICPTEEVAIADNVNNDMTFDQAFETARDEVGPGGMFSWNNNTYNTFYKEEWNGMSLDQKQDYLASVGYETTSSEEQMAENNEATTTTGDVAVQNVDNEQDEAPAVQPTDDDKPAATTKPEVKETMIDGKTAYAIDNDGDGVVDALVFLDSESDNPIALIDTAGDNALDTVAVLDPTTLEPIESAAMGQTFEIAMDDIEAINEEDTIIEDSNQTTNDTEDEDNDYDITDNHDYPNDDNVDDIA